VSTKKRKGKPPKGYDSWFEYDLHTGVLKDCAHHTEVLPYTQQKTYEPDFQLNSKHGIIFIEAKGRFRDSAEARKYVDVRESIDRNDELVFLFYEPKTPMPRARRRNDGTKFTMAEWADKNEFRYFTEHTVTQLLKGVSAC
jgi:hypothetical protein|tara:strand:- start:41 stop:463 length:423 start_codon:yes stop_codon:yes gene_type:complete